MAGRAFDRVAEGGAGPADRSYRPRGKAEDAFHLVLPTWSWLRVSRQAEDRRSSLAVARAWDELMRRLAKACYVAQGGRLGAIISEVMASAGLGEALGIHTNMPGTVPPECRATGTHAPAGSDQLPMRRPLMPRSRPRQSKASAMRR